MKAEKKLTNVDYMLQYKCAFVFFGGTFLLNITLNPLLMWLEVTARMSSFITNSIGISALTCYIILVMHKKYKDKKQAMKIILAVTLFVTWACHYFLYRI